MAHSYAHLFALPTTGLPFFTVYGPWGRPDMAVWLFTAAVIDGRPIRLFNNGRMRRDFTYIGDVTEAVARLVRRAPPANPAWSGTDPGRSSAPWTIYNVGNSRAVELTDVVRLIEAAVGRSARCEFLPMQPGDVMETCADSTELEQAIGFRPQTPIDEGIRMFVTWFRGYRRRIGERVDADG